MNEIRNFIALLAITRTPCGVAWLTFAFCFALQLGCSRAAPPPPGTLSLAFFDVGQGDSLLLQSPAGKRVLIDGGPPESAEALLAALGRHQVDSLDLIILTHPHLDHLGGLAKVVQRLPVRAFLDSGFPHPSPAYTALLLALQARGVPVKNAQAGRRIDLGDGAVLTLLGPPAPALSHTRSDVNANSVASRLSWRRTTALLTGDAEPETEAHLLQQGVELAAGLLKVAHHGGRFSSTAALLQAVRPEIAVISAGARNDYGHPTREALARLQAVGARVYRTDWHGEVTALSDGVSWRVRTAREAPAPPAGSAPAARTQPPATASGERVGSRRSEVFHLPGCPGAQAIRPGNLVRFESREAALAQGRRPAGDCRP